MFWDRVAFAYDLFVKVVNRRTHARLKEIVGREIAPGDFVLECACGTGMLSEVICRRCGQLIACDLSMPMLGRAQKNLAAFTNVTFAQADITCLGYPSDTFDKVVAGNVIHLLDDPLRALADMNRVLKPGGKLIIATYLSRGKGGKEGALVRSLDLAGANFKRQFTPDLYSRFFLDAGYEDVRVSIASGLIPCGVAVMGKKGW